MSRRTILILTAIILIALGAWVYVAYKRSEGTSTTGSQKTLLGSLFPFGNSTASPAPANGGTTGTTGGESAGTPATGATDALIQISNKLTAGFTVLPPDTSAPIPVVDLNAPATASGTAAVVPAAPVFPIVRFVEKGTGYIYDVDAQGKNETKISGTVIAQAAEALFGDDGNTAIVRYATNSGNISTFLGHITPPKDSLSDGTLIGDFLPSNILDITMSNDGKSFLYIVPSAGGVTGMTEDTNGGSKQQRFVSSFTEWLLNLNDGGPVVTAKASASVPGYAYNVTNSGVFQKIIGGIDGLTTKTSPDGKILLYSVSDGQGVELHILHLQGNSDVDTGLHTLPEKCAWNAASTVAYCGASASVVPAAYPDAWYQGVVHFNDAFWKIDMKTNLTTQINDGEGNYLDATNLETDQNEDYLFFTNNTDGSLWSLALAPPPAQTPVTSALPPVK